MNVIGIEKILDPVDHSGDYPLGLNFRPHAPPNLALQDKRFVLLRIFDRHESRGNSMAHTVKVGDVQAEGVAGILMDKSELGNSARGSNGNSGAGVERGGSMIDRHVDVV